MRHGGLVRITGDAFYLSADLHRPLFIDDGSTAWGILHPPATMDEDLRDPYTLVSPDPSEALQFPNDFVFTAIPPRWWPIVARIEIYLSHRQGSLFQVADYLQQQKINILYSECSREARTHAVWSLIVAFEDLYDEASNLNIEPGGALGTTRSRSATDVDRFVGQCRLLYKKTRERLIDLVGRPDRLVQAMGSKMFKSEVSPWGRGLLRSADRWAPCPGVRLESRRFRSPIYLRYGGTDGEQPAGGNFEDGTLGVGPPRAAFSVHEPTDGDRPYPPLAIDGQVLYELQYFHERVLVRQLNHGAGSEFRPFRVECRKDSAFLLGNNGQEVMMNRRLEGQLPTYGVAVTVPEHGFLRVSLIPPLMLGQFRRIEIPYEVTGGGGTVATLADTGVSSNSDPPPGPREEWKRSMGTGREDFIGAGAGSGRGDRPSAGRARLPAGRAGHEGRGADGVEEPPFTTSMGLLASITRELSGSFSFWRAVNHTQRLREPERGRLLFLVRCLNGVDPDERLREALSRVSHSNVRLDAARVTPIAPFRMFVSFRQNWPRWRDLERLLRLEASKLGIRDEDVVVVSGAIGMPWLRVRQELELCDAVLQVSIVDGDPTSQFGWLDAEAFAAWCMRKPMVIIGDPNALQGARPMMQGIPVEPLRANCPDDEAREAFRKGIELLMRARSHGHARDR